MGRILKPMVRGGGWYPSKKWIPLVKNGGYTTQNGGDNVNWAKVSGASPLSLPNALAHFINSLRQFGKCTVSGTDITCNNGVLKYGAGKNKLPLVLSAIKSANTSGTWDGNVYTINGITFAFTEEEGYVSQVVANGTASATTNVILNNTLILQATEYTLSGCASVSTGVYLRSTRGIVITDGGSGATGTADGTSALYLTIQINSGISVPSLVFKPMVRLASITDPTFEPYTEGIYADGTPEEIRVVGKNLIKPLYSGRTNNGITYTINDDGIITANGTATNDSYATATIRIYDPQFLTFVRAGTYMVSGGKSNTKRVYMAGTYVDNTNIPARYSTGNAVSLTLTQDAYIYPQVLIYSGETCSDDVFEIQLELGSTATEYAPFHQETATASNLFAVGSVTDEQDIISGKITRRCEPVVSDGTTPSGRYIGTVGEGNIIVQTKETGYSGAIASFTADKAEPLSGLVAQINPVQDLHGQSSPWPAGGGKNKCDGIAYDGAISSNIPRISSKTPVASPHSISTGFGGVCFFAKVESGNTYALSSDETGASQTFYWAIYSSLDDALNITNALQSGSTNVSFTAEHDGYVLFMRYNTTAGTSVTWTYAQTEVGSSATAYAPYSNICPISGWQGCEVYDTGHNAWDEVLENGYIDANGNNAPSSAIIRSKNYIPVKGGQSYCFHITDTATMWMSITQYDADKNFISQINSLTNYVMTLDANTKYVRFYASAAYGTTYNHDISINYPSTDTTYHAYTGEAISVSFGTTVYGGSDEVIGGNGTSTMGMVDLGDLNWSYYDIHGWTVDCSALHIKPVANNAVPMIGLCEYYPVTSKIDQLTAQENGGVACAMSYNAAYLYVSNGSNTVRPQGKLVYELATPQSFTHECQSVDTLVGQNNVWVDTGNVTAYIPDFTTEQVAGQSLSTTEGTNTVFETSNVDPVEIEVEYAVVPDEE